MLPSQNDPLILADGTVIDVSDGSVVHEEEEVLVEIPNNEQMQREIVSARTRIAELPIPPNQMNSVSVILTYTLYGVTDEDIGTLLSISTQQVETIKKSDVYSSIQDKIVDNIVKSDQDVVRNLFTQQSITAATKVGALLESESESTQLAAAKDILDRGGHRPVDVVEHRHKLEGGLTIEYVEKKDEDIPIIDVTPEGEF